MQGSLLQTENHVVTAIYACLDDNWVYHLDRNGQTYDGPEARDHINMKYEYYREKVETAEDFIKYAATKSMISGRKYKIHCPGDEPVYSADWLSNELNIFRKTISNK